MLLPSTFAGFKPERAALDSHHPINRGAVLVALSGGRETENLVQGGPKISSTLPVPLKPTSFGLAADLRDDTGNVANGMSAPTAIGVTAVTASLWVNFGAVGSWDRMLEINSSTPTTDSLAIYRRSGQDNYKVDCYIGGTRYQTNGIGITQGLWYHFVLEARNTGASSAEVRLWENLTLQITQTKGSGGGFTLGWITSALGYAGAQNATYGRFSDWRVWNRTLSDRERRLLYLEKRIGIGVPWSIGVKAPAGGTTHDLTVNALDQAVALDAAAVTRIVGVAPASLSQAVTFDAATVVRIVGLAADALAQGTALDAATLTRLVGLTVDELTQAVALDAVDVARAIGLTVDPIGQAATLDAAAVTRILGLLPDPMGQSLTLAAASLGVVYSLGAQAMAQAATLDDPSLGLLVSIAVDSLLSSSALDSVSVNKAIQLTVDALAQATALDAADVTRIRSLVVNALLQAQALDTVTLARVVQLTVADILQGVTLTGPALSRILGLTVNDLLLSVYLDSVVLADAAPPRYVELNGVQVDLVALLAKKIDALNLTGKQ